jgi:hypothetical protein
MYNLISFSTKLIYAKTIRNIVANNPNPKRTKL